MYCKLGEIIIPVKSLVVVCWMSTLVLMLIVAIDPRRSYYWWLNFRESLNCVWCSVLKCTIWCVKIQPITVFFCDLCWVWIGSIWFDQFLLLSFLQVYSPNPSEDTVSQNQKNLWYNNNNSLSKMSLLIDSCQWIAFHIKIYCLSWVILTIFQVVMNYVLFGCCCKL